MHERPNAYCEAVCACVPVCVCTVHLTLRPSNPPPPPPPPIPPPQQDAALLLLCRQLYMASNYVKMRHTSLSAQRNRPVVMLYLHVPSCYTYKITFSCYVRVGRGGRGRESLNLNLKVSRVDFKVHVSHTHGLLISDSKTLNKIKLLFYGLLWTFQSMGPGARLVIINTQLS